MSDTTEDRTIFYIPDTNLEAFEAACAKLSRKAERIGCSEIKPFIFGHTMQKLSDGREHRVYEILFTADAPKVEGWTFVARLDHSNETGNIIRMVPNTIESIPTHYRDCAPHCDHCNLKRKRRDTFILHCDATDEFKQVGHTCLQDFFGHDPLKMARMAELLGYAYESARGAEEFSGAGLADLRWFNVEDYCAFAAAACRLFGWTSGKAAYENSSLTATRKRATDWYIWRDAASNSTPVVADEDKAVAAAALAWAQSLREKDNLSDYESNILVISEAPYMEARSAGLAASIVGIHLRNVARQGTPKLVDPGHIGTVGEKITLPVTVTRYNTTNGAYGVTHIYRMVTNDGNVLVWFSSNAVGVQEGEKVTLKGTVKAHDEYRGTKQTIVTRCKMVKA